MSNVRRLALAVTTLIALTVGAAFELRPVYGVIVERDGDITARGYVELNFTEKTYSWSNQTGREAARGYYEYTQRRLRFDGQLAKWGEGVAQPDGRIVFGNEGAIGYYVRCRPASRVTAWPFD